ncbi:Uncharacterized membrane protein YtjA, UPF0391 family [Geoalkalibacter ferrihydriticus]|uniref:Uncharacterized membrane protein YtjA, UPF0391 family n=1 Tax=Geoalkalibacter ferrihydriticus TaxID=392333 RepID=A0A1G9Q396_9BACT|nr:DUF1328 family protein [Geoalkalibacter ferrihydriticus]SDM05459.1 Uncharacterized membrane protein YtjA, UPF0391 family [Geoalkalibacter ferrihydriticus]
MKDIMLNWATVFFTIACIALVLGFLNISPPVTKIAKILCGIFTVLFTLALVVGLQQG